MSDVTGAPRVSRIAAASRASQILRIAAEIRALVAVGRPVCNLTVGDFNPRQFPAPAALVAAIQEALSAGETNYPPSSGLPVLREAIAAFYAQRLGIHYTSDAVIVAAGARPCIYTAFRTLLDPGDAVVFPVPSWNNADYCQLVGATARPVTCTDAMSFLPTRAALARAIRGARLLVLNSPLNPSGTAFDEATLGEICDLVLEENTARTAADRPLFLLYDQVYWMLTLGRTRHVHPVVLRPDMEPYVISVDAISKAFASTGLRVGWVTGPRDVVRHMADFVSHIGAWAPRPGQLGTARLFGQPEVIDAYHQTMHRELAVRLDAIHSACTAMRAAGLPVDSIPPVSTIYASVRLDLDGRRTPDGTVLCGSEDVRRYLLNAAGVAVIPFQAFGITGDTGWFRFSVGAVSKSDLESGLVRLRSAVEALVASE
ncbi:MAG TPA: aminotransferase class I/II-fold pyridoxal phosphate-dependent enzyme [Gemmatimonadaceae bacterium]